MQQNNKEVLYEAEDLQGGTFGADRQLTIEGWREQALEWCDMDENDELAECIQCLEQAAVLSYISQIWDLKFTKIGGNQ